MFILSNPEGLCVIVYCVCCFIVCVLCVLCVVYVCVGSVLMLSVVYSFECLVFVFGKGLLYSAIE